MRLPRGITVRAEALLRGGRRWRVDLDVGGAGVPAVLLLPDATPVASDTGDAAGRARPSPHGAAGALLLHGYSSRKELMVETVGEALLRRGLASLAIDLPLHGDRAAPVQEQALRNPLLLLRQWKLAIAEATAALHLLGDVPGVDRGRLALVGYSMGAYLAVTVAAAEPAARAVVLAAGGDLPERTPLAALVRRVADPRAAVRALRGRPLLMVHGRQDRTVRPEQAERLFAAAGEPKTLRWWDAGHYLPPAAIDEAAAWLAGTMGMAGRATMP